MFKENKPNLPLFNEIKRYTPHILKPISSDSSFYYPCPLQNNPRIGQAADRFIHEINQQKKKKNPPTKTTLNNAIKIKIPTFRR